MLVVVLDAHGGETALDATAASRLADLGVTHVAIARDETTEAVVLEGWAFDSVASGAEATEIVAGTAMHNTLHPVLQTLLSRVRGEGIALAVTARPGAQPDLRNQT
jgi:hypothetical protein